ncbi:FMN reductase [Pseudoglutamicibacter cumminsii]|uniref:FMN reductase n=1 Tax=Pseudoglutamicibacter cumminsii TaxID=156979 RepID=UPI0026EDDDC5|nr:FMN reductase [Pseudoglutamicibacter cumminsii]
MTLKLVAVTAGLSQPSSTRLLTDQIVNAVRASVTARGEDVEAEIIEVREIAQDLTQTMLTGGMPTPKLTEVREKLATADGVVAVTPVFTASMSGLFKMLFDSLDVDTLRGVPVLAAATAGTPRHQLVIDHAMRPMFAYLHATVVPTGVFAATEDFGTEAGKGLAGRIAQAADELTQAMMSFGNTVAGFIATQQPAGKGGRQRTSGNELTDVVDFATLLEGHDGTPTSKT